MRFVMVLFLTLAARADSIGPVFALQQATGVVAKFDNPSNVLLGMGMPLLEPSHGMSCLMFVSSLASLNGSVDFTLTIGGIAYATDGFVHFAGCRGNCSLVDSFLLPRGFYRPTPASLTVSFQGESKQFNFNFIEPVPEPVSLLLLATGLGMIAWKIRHHVSV